MKLQLLALLSLLSLGSAQHPPTRACLGKEKGSPCEYSFGDINFTNGTCLRHMGELRCSMRLGDAHKGQVRVNMYLQSVQYPEYSNGLLHECLTGQAENIINRKADCVFKLPTTMDHTAYGCKMVEKPLKGAKTYHLDMVAEESGYIPIPHSSEKACTGKNIGNTCNFDISFGSESLFVVNSKCSQGDGLRNKHADQAVPFCNFHDGRTFFEDQSALLYSNYGKFTIQNLFEEIGDKGANIYMKTVSGKTLNMACHKGTPDMYHANRFKVVMSYDHVLGWNNLNSAPGFLTSKFELFFRDRMSLHTFMNFLMTLLLIFQVALCAIGMVYRKNVKSINLDLDYCENLVKTGSL